MPDWSEQPNNNFWSRWRSWFAGLRLPGRILVLVVSLLVLGGLGVLASTLVRTLNPQPPAVSGVVMRLQPSDQQVGAGLIPGQSLAVDILLDAGAAAPDKIVSVQAVLTFDTARLSANSIDTSTSAFSTDVSQGTFISGNTVSVVRGEPAPGLPAADGLIVARINFTVPPSAPAGTAAVTFDTTQSKVIALDANLNAFNILFQVQSENYPIGQEKLRITDVTWRLFPPTPPAVPDWSTEINWQVLRGVTSLDTANCQVGYDTRSHEPFDSSDPYSAQAPGRNIGNGQYLANLKDILDKQRYFFRVFCQEGGDEAMSQEFTFTTTGEDIIFDQVSCEYIPGKAADSQINIFWQLKQGNFPFSGADCALPDEGVEFRTAPGAITGSPTNSGIESPLGSGSYFSSSKDIIDGSVYSYQITCNAGGQQITSAIYSCPTSLPPSPSQFRIVEDSVTALNVSDKQATIIWNTEPASLEADSVVRYYLNGSADEQLPLCALDREAYLCSGSTCGEISDLANLTNAHRLTLTNLLENTAYCFMVESTATSGENDWAAGYSFTTKLGDFAEDANVVLKVDRDRTCGKWLYCRSSVETQTVNNTKENLCFDLGLCAKLNPETGECLRPVTSDQLTNYKLVADSSGFRPDLSTVDQTVNLSGLSKQGLDWLGVCANDSQRACLQAADCGGSDCLAPVSSGFTTGGVEGIYHFASMRQVGTDVRVSNSDFSTGNPFPWEAYPQPAHAVLAVNAAGQLEINPTADPKKQKVAGAKINLHSAIRANQPYFITFEAGAQQPTIVRLQFLYQQGEKLQPDLRSPYTKDILINGPGTYLVELAASPDLLTETTWLAILDYLADGESEFVSFFIDNVQIQPVLQVAESRFIARSCRLFPTEDAPECDFVDIDSGKEFRGWKGYCVERDPKNADRCLLWYPVDIIEGANAVFSADRSVGYQDRLPLYYCLEAKGNAPYLREMDIETDCATSGSVRCGNSDTARLIVLPGEKDSDWDDRSGILTFEGDDIKDVFGEVLGEIPRYELEQIILTGKDGEGSDWPEGQTFSLNRNNNWEIVWCGGGGCPEEKALLNGGWRRYASSEGACNDLSGGTNLLGVKANFSKIIPNRLSNIEAGLCDDSKGHGWIEFKVEFVLREQCQALVKVVDSFGNGVPWQTRIKPTSPTIDNYGIGLGYGYDQDFKPFGGVVNPASGSEQDPQTWDLPAPLPVEPPDTTFGQEPYQARAGSPYAITGGGICTFPESTEGNACNRPSDCDAFEQGVCREEGGLTGQCEGGPNPGDECNPNDPNSCSGFAQGRCTAGRAGLSVCISGNEIGKACSTHQECGIDIETGRTGRCSGFDKPDQVSTSQFFNSLAGGAVQGARNLQQLFAKSLGVWRWGYDAEEQRYKYIQICEEGSKEAFGGADCPGWDITFQEGKAPRVSNLKVNGRTADAEGPAKVIYSNGIGTAALTFNSFVEPDQLPLTSYTVDWGDGRLAGEAGLKTQDRQDENNPHLLVHTYECFGPNLKDGSVNPNWRPGVTVSGDGACVFVPRVQIRDNWGWCNGVVDGSDADNDDLPDNPTEQGYHQSSGGCDLSLNNPWTYFAGQVVVCPPGVTDCRLATSLPFNQPPVAVNDVQTTLIDTPVTITVLANDFDPDGTLDLSSVTIVASPVNGSVTVDNSTGLVLYTPNTGFSGVDKFTYIVQDNLGDVSNEAEVTVNVNVNEPPLINNFQAQPVSGFPPLATNLTADISDPDNNYPLDGVLDFGDGSSSAVFNLPAANSISFNYSYTTSGQYTAVLTITDSLGASNSATVTINVASNNPPTITNFIATPQTGRAPLDVVFNASILELDGDYPVDIIIDFGDGTLPASIILDNAGQTSIPPTNHTYVDDGIYTAALTATDSQGASANQSLTVSVNRANRPPDLPFDLIQEFAGSSLAEGAVATDATPRFTFSITDPDGDDVSYQIQIATDPSFTAPVIDFSWTTGSLPSGSTFNFDVLPNQALSNGSYYWRVKARDTAGLESDWVEFGKVAVVDFKISWWNGAYQYRRQLTVANNFNQALSAPFPVQVIVDTQGLIQAGKLLTNGNDLRLVYDNGSQLIELDRHLINLNANQTFVWFSLQADLPVGGSDSNYWLYYGNSAAGQAPENLNNIFYPDKAALPCPAGANCLDQATVAVYHFEDGLGSTTLLNSAGSGLIGNLRNMDEFSAWVAGRFGQGLQFDGVDDYVEIIHNSLLALPQGTIEFWARNEKGGNDDSTFFSKDHQGYGQGGHIYTFVDNSDPVLAGRVHYRLQSTSQSFHIYSDSDVHQGFWEHIAVTWGPSGQKMYVNGKLQFETNSYTGGIENNTWPLLLGAANYRSAPGGTAPLFSFLKGRLDGFRISNIQRTSFPYAQVTCSSSGCNNDPTAAAGAEEPLALRPSSSRLARGEGRVAGASDVNRETVPRSSALSSALVQRGILPPHKAMEMVVEKFLNWVWKL